MEEVQVEKMRGDQLEDGDGKDAQKKRKLRPKMMPGNHSARPGRQEAEMKEEKSP